MSPGIPRFPRPLRAVLPLALLWLAPGCETFQTALGMKQDLRGKPIQHLEAEVRGGSALCPGAHKPLVVTAILDDGTRLVSEGAGGGKLLWDSFRLQPVGALTVSPQGELFLDKDPQRHTAGPLAVRVEALGASRATVVEVPLSARYDCAFVADFSGKPGHPGANGQNGSLGLDGHDIPDASMSSARRGISGGYGGPGANGSVGETGQGGDNVEVEVSLAGSAEHPLLQVLTRGVSSGRSERFLVEPQGGSLTIRTHGGTGGAGGRGGIGGSGGQGGDGLPPGNGGNGGAGGSGGNGGDGGPGGHILVRLTPEARAYQQVLRFENRGGLGGPGGPGGPGGRGGRAGTAGLVGRSMGTATPNTYYMASRGM
ncbi:MAG: hypothetical protein ACXU86_15710, partial [Archangium sp.]